MSAAGMIRLHRQACGVQPAQNIFVLFQRGGFPGLTSASNRFSLKAGMTGIETAQATQHQTNPIAPRWTFRVRTH
jgi:hypothetical protein